MEVGKKMLEVEPPEVDGGPSFFLFFPPFSRVLPGLSEFSPGLVSNFPPQKKKCWRLNLQPPSHLGLAGVLMPLLWGTRVLVF